MFGEGVLPLCREAVGVFYSTSQVVNGWKKDRPHREEAAYIEREREKKKGDAAYIEREREREEAAYTERERERERRQQHTDKKRERQQHTDKKRERQKVVYTQKE